MTAPPSEITCPVCRRAVDLALFRSAYGMEAEVVRLVETNTPGWDGEQGLCEDCARRFVKAQAYLVSHGEETAAGILPTGLRLGASARFRGRGVTIAFLDSGFYGHPDLVEPQDRIAHYVDITDRKAGRERLAEADDSSWHGMMTSVVACGNGRLSRGLYRGLASEARLVLVKVGTVRRIPHENIERGLQWVVRNRKRFGIRIVNVSCGGDYAASYLVDGLSRAAEAASRAGILVCAAVGNLGAHPDHPVVPPASAPSALTVGGVDDRNKLAFAGYRMYHSSYGPTIDGLQKPEVIAPGIWVAAPVLPGTSTAARLALWSRLSGAPDETIAELASAAPGVDADLDTTAPGLAPEALRELARERLRGENAITPHYKHVDGTSFAAPIVASVAAQLLEANPDLRPHEVKRILITTARRIAEVDVDQQGWGVVDPARAVAEALRRRSAPASGA